MSEIPRELLPAPQQYPPFITTDEDRRRWAICFALTRLVAQRDDPIFCRQLFGSDASTGDATLPGPLPA